VDPLVKTLGKEADNVAFLMQMTETILLGYRDAIAPDAISTERLLTVVSKVYWL